MLGARRSQTLMLSSLAAVLACGPSDANRSESADESGEGDGDGDGDGDEQGPPATATLVALHDVDTRSLTLVAVDFDAAEPTPIPVTELGPGDLLGYARWFPGHGQVLQAGREGERAPAKLIRFAAGEIVATPIAPAPTHGRIRKLEFNAEGTGALLFQSSNFAVFPSGAEEPESCDLVWITYDSLRQPGATTPLESMDEDCVWDLTLRELELDPAGDLAAWLLRVDGQTVLRAVEIADSPGSVRTLAVTPSLIGEGLVIRPDWLGVTLDLDGDGAREFVVYDRADLDAPPTVYPFAGPTEYASWAASGDWAVWRPGLTRDVMFMAFEGSVPTPPVALVGPGITGGFGERVSEAGTVRFIYQSPGLAPGDEPLAGRGFAEVEIGANGPSPALALTGPLPDDEQVAFVTSRQGTDATAYLITSVPIDFEAPSAVALLDTGTSPIDARVHQLPTTGVSLTWAPSDARRLLVFEELGERRISVIDLEQPEPHAQLLLDGEVGDLTIHQSGWSARGEHVLAHLLRMGELTTPDALARIPVEGGEPELVLSREGARIHGWWNLVEGE